MDVYIQPLSVFTGFPPTTTLLESLIAISNEITSIDRVPPIQVKNIATMIQRIRLLSPLFQEIYETNIPLLPSAILCFTELLYLTTKAKFLIQYCTQGSYLWSIIQIEAVSKEFREIVQEMSKALDILPLELLNVTVDVSEQVELLHKQAKRATLLVDHKDIERRKELVQIIAMVKEKDDENFALHDLEPARDFLSSLGVRSSVDFAAEILKLKAEADRQAGSGGPLVVSTINRLISYLSFARSMFFSFEENGQTVESLDVESSSSRAVLIVPDHFRCPISLEIMKEPVTISTGHTYDRDSITQWINSGHKTCPRSGQRLTHMALIPNYNIKSLIYQWLQDNKIPLDEFTSSYSELQKSNIKEKVCISAVRVTAEFLVGKLATASTEMQCRAAYEIRLLAKSNMHNRRIIVEAGAILFLVNLLSSEESEMQENAVTALLNLSIHTNNKILIMEAGALEKILLILESGKTMKSRENAAATLASLSVMDDNKVTIGAQSRAITTLISLLQEGATTGKRDAATALLNLSLYNPNKREIVHAGAVPLLVDILMDEKAGITDDALALLVSIQGCIEGMNMIKESRDLLPLLVDLLKVGSPKGKENSVTLLLTLIKDEGQETVKQLDPQCFPLLRSLTINGSSETQRKASKLLRLLIRYCSNPAL